MSELSRQQFDILYAYLRNPGVTQREIAEATEFSLGTVNTVYNELKKQGLISEQAQISTEGLKALAPYKVDNAIIMAAGLSTRFAPISYEKPKGMLTVYGEILIERQIRQLQEAGITDIIVVVGYMKEQFFYLAEEFGVQIVVNPDYAKRNNNSTIMCVADKLGNSFICSSDDYFTENPFEQYVYSAYYASTYANGRSEEYSLITKGKDKRIVRVVVGGEDTWVMLGHAYWDRNFSEAFVRILKSIYDDPFTFDMLWEDVYRTHVDEFYMVRREYAAGIVHEFDTLAELQEFDPSFIENVDSEIIDNICSVLDCRRTDIKNVNPIKQGLTNLSFSFEAGKEKYVYRHPGAGTDEIINRASEAASQEVGRELGLDTTYIYEHPEKGWKISQYIEGCDILDYEDWDSVEKAIGMVKKLHNCGVDTGFPYDVYEGAKEIIAMLGPARTTFKDFDELYSIIDNLYHKAAVHGAKTCLCHNDFYPPNLLIAGDRMELIDWEYSGMSDFANDLGTLICCSDNYTYDDALRVFRIYFDGEPTEEQLFHCVAYVAIESFYWFVWAIYKEEAGDPVGEWLYLWYRYVKDYGQRAFEMAQRLGY